MRNPIENISLTITNLEKNKYKHFNIKKATYNDTYSIRLVYMYHVWSEEEMQVYLHVHHPSIMCYMYVSITCMQTFQMLLKDYVTCMLCVQCDCKLHQSLE